MEYWIIPISLRGKKIQNEREKDTKVIMALGNEKPSDRYSGQKRPAVIGISNINILVRTRFS